MNKKILLIILIISFGACLCYSLYFKIKPVVDARAYDVIASNLANGNGYRENLNVDLAHDSAIVRVGPLYEYFLAGIYKIFGHNYVWVWFFQALLHAVSAWLIYKTSQIIFSDSEKKRKIGLLAAGVFGFYPDLIEISAMLMTETLYLFLICLALYVFFLYFVKLKGYLAVLLGIAAGLAVLARPPFLFLLPIVLFYPVSKRKFFHAGLFLFALVLIFLPWTIRNYQVYDKIMPFGAAGNYNFWIGNYHGANGEQVPSEEMLKYNETHQAKDINSESMRQFKNFLQEYPLEFIKLTALRINKYFSLIRPMGFWFYQKGWGQVLFILFSALASVFLFIFGLAGLIKGFKSDNVKLHYLAVFTVITPLILFITVVETRYRFQIYPLLAIFAAWFVFSPASLKDFWRDSIWRWSSAILIANGLIDFFLSIGKISEKLRGFF